MQTFSLLCLVVMWLVLPSGHVMAAGTTAASRPACATTRYTVGDYIDDRWPVLVNGIARLLGVSPSFFRDALACFGEVLIVAGPETTDPGRRLSNVPVIGVSSSVSVRYFAMSNLSRASLLHVRDTAQPHRSSWE